MQRKLHNMFFLFKIINRKEHGNESPRRHPCLEDDQRAQRFLGQKRTGLSSELRPDNVAASYA